MRRFLSICSGIEAASVAFQPLGWEAVAVAEIEPFPCAVLAQHYPQVPNLGDLRQFRTWDTALLEQADMLCGGTPCQAFSVAGLRGSLDDERGNLTLTFCHLYDYLDDLRRRAGRPPAVCLWENVPGILSDSQNAFGSFLAGLAGESVPLQPPGGRWAHAGYVRGPRRAVAWRILDAQYFGLAQRRQRVFVVGSADPAFDPAAVLFELDGLRRDSPPRRETGEGTAHDLAPSLTSSGRGVERPGESRGQCPVVAFSGNNTAGPIEAAPALNANRGCHNPGDFEAGALLVQPVAHALRGEGFDASEDGTGSGTPLVPAIAFPERMSGTQCASSEELSPVLQSHNPTAVALFVNEVAPTLRSGSTSPRSHGKQNGTDREALVAYTTSPHTAWRVRRLTPEECELLQGFPIGYTLIPGRHRLRKARDLEQTVVFLRALGYAEADAAALAHCPDGPRYKALGNSWAVPCVRWIGQRITAHLETMHTLPPE